ncbi:rolling circle replication-associated protein [Spiroplasma endosymbiont of Stenodema calcarata]|uniref:rolling circle replication-associated protein n=1 Tax=Spiroplasma endosymbiont of Stenodema calcarata TaxID=3139328 RepID=UPI003CCA939B
MINKTKKNCYRSQKNCIQKANYNFSECNNLTFITLTFKENITDIREANKYFKKWIQKLQYYYGSDFKYLRIYDYQKCGAIHFNIILNKQIPTSVLQKHWKYGIIKNLVVNNENKTINEFVFIYITERLIKAETKKVYDLYIRAYEFSRNCQNPQVKVNANYE